MLKLPVCPYCHAVYNYKEVSLMQGNSRQQCYHCKREFSVAKRNGKIIIILAVCILLIAFDLMMLYSSKSVNFTVMIITNVICVSASFLLFPLTVKFYPVKIKKFPKK